MCLDKVFQEKIKSSGIGYKVFYHVSGGPEKFRFWIRKFEEAHEVPQGKWLFAESVLLSCDKVRYISGFHIFLNKKKAWEWAKWSLDEVGYGAVVVQVRYRGASVIGEQFGIRTVVADEMYVAKRPKVKWIKKH